MSDYHPCEIWNEIFARLPVRSILQLRLVCKQFHGIISDPAFRTDHIKKSERNHKLLLRHFSNKERQKKHHCLMLNDEDQRLDVRNSEDIKFPFEFSLNPSNWTIGSLDGLVCLCMDASSADEIALWNPSIRKRIYLPKPKANKDGSNCYCVFGFGFDPITTDCKVVRLTHLKNNDGVPPTVELFTLSSQSWRTLINNIDARRHVYLSLVCNADHGSISAVIYENIWPQTYLKRTVHWIGYEPTGIPRGNLIISFHMSGESFGKIMLPDVLATEIDSKRLSVSVLKNMLSVSHLENNSQKEWYFIWVMEEYSQVSSWTKLYTIDLEKNISKTDRLSE